MKFLIIFINQQKKKVSIVTFTCYIYSGEDHVLTPEVAFVCLTLFDIIKMPLALLPMLIVYMVQVITSKQCFF